MSFEGQHAFVMGGSSGIGEATARQFAAAGAHVVITGRSKERLEGAAERIGHPVDTQPLDGQDGDAVTRFFATAGPVDHLVLALSPGAVAIGPLASLAESDLRAAFDGKFFTHVRIVRAALPNMAVRAPAPGAPGPSITFISAASARSAGPGTAGLAAANGAIEAMVPPLAAELAPIRVNAVSPGVIDTPWWHGLPAEQRTAFFEGTAASVPAGRVGHPDDVASSVLYLAGNGFVTGTVLDCSGGLTLATGH
jgi:NAD(P)-dependent dehydrogenase (short-subunit alcohol dehydrogenase family)